MTQSQTSNNGFLICSTLEALLSLYDPFTPLFMELFAKSCVRSLGYNGDQNGWNLCLQEWALVRIDVAGAYLRESDGHIVPVLDTVQNCELLQ